MRFIEKRTALSALAIALYVGSGGSVYAQDSSTDDGTSQDAADIFVDEITNAEGVPVSEGQIVVTGSRIRRDTFNTSSPVDVITKDDAILGGVSSAADLLQDNTVTSGSGQINDTFVGYVSEGGSGASTVGLRGFGASRTLLLLNGRRLAPAGVGPQLVAADLNVLPLAMVQRVEVLREGASSVYGSDAIAGVINIITETDYDGLTFDAYTEQPFETPGAGQTYRLSAVAGKTFDRGHITASVEFRQKTGMRFNDRKDFTCPTDLFFNAATGEPFGQRDAVTGDIRCHPFEYASLGTAQNYLLGINYGNGTVNRFTYNNGDNSSFYLVNDYDLRPNASPVEDQAHVIPPIKTITGYLNGSFEITPSLELYGEALFTNRKGYYDYSSQISLRTDALTNILYGGRFAAYTYASPFFPNAIADAGYDDLRFFIVPPLRRSGQDVDFGRANLGLRGELGISDWRFDANVQFSKTKSTYTNQLIDSRNMDAAIYTVLAPEGTPDANITVALPGTAGAGNAYTCASNVDGDGNFISGSTCVPFDPFNPQVLAGNVPQNVLDFLYIDTVGKTKFEQITGQFVIDGSLFKLPGGTARFAAGVELRKDKLRDVPDEASQTGNLYGYSSSGITTGKDTVKEIFGELELPLLSDRPFVHELTVGGSARYTDYDSYGSDWTWSVKAQYAPIPELAFRGSYGTPFRAPNLYEQYVADLSGFYGYDPCNDFALRYDPGDNVYDNCLADITSVSTLNNDSDGDGINDNWVANGTPESFTKGGAGVLKAETSDSWNVGAVLNLPFGDSDFSFAVDYWGIDLRDEVATLGPTILDECYESDEFRASNFYCQFVGPRESSQGTILEFDDPYINVASQKAEGIDFNTRFASPLGGGRFIAQLHATRMLKQIYQNFDAFDPVDYNGLLGYATTSGGPKWTGSLDLRYSFPGDKFTVRYGLDYTGPMDSSNDLVDPPLEIDNTEVTYDLHASTYWEHSLSFQYNWSDIAEMTLGVSNLFNEKPPIVGSYGSGSNDRRANIGNYFNYSAYDFIGRRVFLNVTRKF